MAIYHCTAKTASKAKGHSAKAKALYILRQGKYHRSKLEVLFSLSGNMPGWAKVNPVLYWAAADDHERGNGRLFKEVEFALPVELGLEEQILLAQRFAERLTADESLPHTLAIHAGKGKNPHCHLMISERINDGINRPAALWFKRHNAKQPELGGGKKTEALKPKEWLERIREAWADLANSFLSRAGLTARIDHRTLEAQGEDRMPQVHMGPNVIEMEEKGIFTDRASRALEIAEANHQLLELHQIEKEIQNEQRTRPRESRPQSARSSRVATATPDRQSTNLQPRKGGVGHGQGAKKTPPAPPTTSEAKPTRPTSQPMSPLPQGDPDMNLSPAEQQEFLRVRRQLVAQQQAEVEARQRRLTEEQKLRFLELEAIAEEAEHTRKDQRFLDHYFAWGCMDELRQQKQTVETADWKQTEGKVAANLLANGANVTDVASLVFDLGLSATGSPIPPANAVEHLKNLALNRPDLADAMRVAERREKDEEQQRRQSDEDGEKAQPKQSFPQLPGV